MFRPLRTPFPALAVGAALVACGERSGPAASPDPARDAAPALTRGAYEQEILLTGELRAVRSVSIKAPETSLFQMRIQFLADEGRWVKQGDPLLTFDSASLTAQVRDLETSILDARTREVAKRAEIASALKDLEIRLAEAEHEARRTSLLAGVDQEVLSRKVWSERQVASEAADKTLRETRDRIRLTRARGRAELDVLAIDREKLERDLITARRDLDLLAIRAPADGLVVHERRQENNQRFQEGDSCWPGQGLVQLPDLSEMEVVFTVHEVDAPLLAEAMPVHVTLDAFPGRALDGSVRRIPSMAVKRADESRVSVFKVVASLSETWAGEMKPGMSALGRVAVGRREDVPLLRRAATTWRDGRCVLVARPDVAVTPLARTATHYVLAEEDAALVASALPTREPAGRPARAAARPETGS
jgi:multidrug efflux pump subunit AcrA (membrane-fusion protein)